jgi:hypothetical protein
MRLELYRHLNCHRARVSATYVESLLLASSHRATSTRATTQRIICSCARARAVSTFGRSIKIFSNTS